MEAAEAAAETREGGAPPSRKRNPLSDRTNTAVLPPPPSKRITRSSAASSVLNHPPPQPPPTPNPITAGKSVDQTTETNKQKSSNGPHREPAAAFPEEDALKKWMSRNFGDSFDANTTTATTTGGHGFQSRTCGRHREVGKENIDPSTGIPSTLSRQLPSSMHPPPPEKEKQTKRPLSEAVPQDDAPKKRMRKNFVDSVDVNTTTTADTLESKSSMSSGHDFSKENVGHSTDLTSTPVRQHVSSMPPPPPVEPLTVCARRRPDKSEGKRKVVDQAFSCPPLERSRSIPGTYPQSSNKIDSRLTDRKVSKSLTGPPKKRRKNDPVVLKDYFEKQRAYFAEIDKCELSEEEISESE